MLALGKKSYIYNKSFIIIVCRATNFFYKYQKLQSNYIHFDEPPSNPHNIDSLPSFISFQSGKLLLLVMIIRIKR